MARPQLNPVCACVALVALVSLLIRVSREHALLRGGGDDPSTEAFGIDACAHSGAGRYTAGAVVLDNRCLNATRLDAGVCVLKGSRARCIPSLAVIGAMKSGTTNVMLYLSLHPRLRTSENGLGWPIETRYFSQARNAEAAESWRGYLERYPPITRRGDFLTFDKSPNYVVNPMVPRVLHRLAPSMKLVVMLRDPTRRAYSHFQHECRNGRMMRDDRTKRTFRGMCVDASKSPEACAAKKLPNPCEAAHFDDMVRWELRLAEQRQRNNSASSDWKCAWSFGGGQGDSNVIPRGLYACQLARWLPLYPSLLPLIFEEFLTSREATLAAVAEVESHLGIPHYDYASSWRVAAVERLYAAVPSRQSYAPMQPDAKQTLDDFYCSPNADLASLLGRPLPWPCAQTTRSS